MRQGELKLEWFEPQMLRQESEMECGVCVFGALTNLSRDEMLGDRFRRQQDGALKTAALRKSGRV